MVYWFGMDYLSFDIECCDGRHICEFGYVVFDESFSVTERGCLLMDPEHEFNLTGREKEPDLVLAFTEEEYRQNPPFPACYDKIRALLTAQERTIVGFALRNDCEFLATAWDLYGKEPIPFSYYDAQRFYKAYAGLTFSPSLERMVEELAVPQEGFTFHRSVDDAYAVVCCLKKIAEDEGKTLAETFAFLRKKCNQNKPFSSKKHSASLAKKLTEGDEVEQEDFLKRFLQRTEKGNGVFSGEIVAVSRTLQQERFNDFLALVAEIMKKGGTYGEDGKTCDVFIGYTGKGTEPDSKLADAMNEKSAGKAIAIIPLRAALEKLSLTENDLKKTAYVHSSAERDEDAGASYVTQATSPTLADLFRNVPRR